MNITFDFLDVNHYEANKTRPVDLIKRGPGESWLVLNSPVVLDDSTWEPCGDGDWVRLPLYSYLTANQDPTRAMAFAMQLGLGAAFRVAAYTRMVPTRIHVAVGDPVLPQGDVFKYWVGFAFLIPTAPR